MPRMRVTKDQIDGYIKFLDELNYIIESIMITDPIRDTEMDMIKLWVKGIEVNHALHQTKQRVLRWKALSLYLRIDEKHLLGTFRSTKFVQYEDFSVRNFLLGYIQEEGFPVKSTNVHLPDHVELKRFWVPEDLMMKQRQDTIYEADWLK